jgi:hypothetical protein
MKLIHKSTGKPVQKGDIVTDFRGDKAKVMGLTPPHREGSTGRLYVEAIPEGYTHGYFPSVFDCEWVQA